VGEPRQADFDLSRVHVLDVCGRTIIPQVLFVFSIILGFHCRMRLRAMAWPGGSGARRMTRNRSSLSNSEERSSENAIGDDAGENSNSSSAEDVRRNRPNVRRYVRSSTAKRDWAVGDIHERFLRAVDQLGGQDSKQICRSTCAFILEFVCVLLSRDNSFGGSLLNWRGKTQSDYQFAFLFNVGRVNCKQHEKLHKKLH